MLGILFQKSIKSFVTKFLGDGREPVCILHIVGKTNDLRVAYNMAYRQSRAVTEAPKITPRK